jgi:hypothetical protein
VGSSPIQTTDYTEGYTVEVAGSTVNALSFDSGGSTPSPSTYILDIHLVLCIKIKKEGFVFLYIQ